MWRLLDSQVGLVCSIAKFLGSVKAEELSPNLALKKKSPRFAADVSLLP